MVLRTLVPGLIAFALLAAACASGGPETLPPDNAPTDVIAFGARTPDGGGLYIVSPDGVGSGDVQQDGTGLPRLFWSEPDVVSSVVWSPDGGRIAYLVGDGEVATLRVYDFDTQTATTVSLLAVTSDAGPSSSWSPDGTRLAFTEAAGEERLVTVYDLALGEAVDSLSVTGAEPAWSPDGEELAFVRVGEGFAIYTLSAEDDEPEALLLESPDRLQAPVWSPDGAQLVVTEGEAGDEALTLIERESGAERGLGPGLNPSWSPDGERLAFSALATDGDTDIDVYFVSLSGDGVPVAVSEAVTRELWPSWSPEGGRLAFLSQADRQTAFICVVRLQPEERDCLNLPNVLPTTLAWSPR